ncbi:PREDICTED: uncharacterized protein LOC103609515 [Galeopterus variegatus]|uniref:Uncharacterized protein LOC103609515 n=1 Tax=Galeopterus variegatus TaxID=482537 RepID=A0ABM0SGQ2_GALVR|nr:PREDICTED: uncharacterized protein LOC103609515 [Galeopterus variegatus]
MGITIVHVSSGCHENQSLSEMKQLLFKLIGLLFSYMSWVFGITLANSRSWCVWEFDSKVVHVVFTGLWEAFYFQNFNISASIVDFPMHSTINKTWAISSEIKYGRGLILLANFMKSSVLIFSATAFWISWIKAPYPDFIQSYYNISAFFLFLSCVCTAGTVTWNFAVDFYGETTLDFPLSFPVEKESLTKKHFSYVFPLGIITATLSLVSASLFCCEARLTKQLNQVKPMAVAKCSEENV